MSAPRALVTGAGGFVGRHIVGALLSAGWHVTALDRAFDTDLALEWQAWRERLAMLSGDAAVLPALDADAVIHAAALTASPQDLDVTPESHVRANLEPTLNVLAWAADRSARAILISSSGVFREMAPGPLDETVPPTPLGLYAVAKAATEALGETLYAEFDRDVAVIRLSNIYGPGELPRPTRPRVSPIGRMLARALETGVLSVYRDDAARDWTYAPDVGHAVVSLLSTPVLNHALYNVASGQQRTPLEVAEVIASVLGGVRINTLDGADPAAPLLTRLGILSGARLVADTGFAEWTPFDDGIAETATWARAQMEIVS